MPGCNIVIAFLPRFLRIKIDKKPHEYHDITLTAAEVRSWPETHCLGVTSADCCQVAFVYNEDQPFNFNK